MKLLKDLIKNESGITLIELIVVLVIIGILSAVVLPKLTGHKETAKRTAAQSQIAIFEQTLQLYKLDNEFFPTTEQGLEALVEQPTTGEIPKNWKEGGYLSKKAIPLDPWGNPYIYISPGVHNKDYDISSYGEDGQEGGEGNNRDINSWEAE